MVDHGKVLGKPISDPELNIAFKHSLHGEQEITIHRPLRGGDIISTTPSIEDIRDNGTGETISIRLRSENQLRALVEETLFVHSDSNKKATGGSSPKATSSATSRGDAPIAIIEKNVDIDQTFRYSEASGDKVKIHLDPEVAKKAGFPWIIGHGLCTLAFNSRAVIDGVGGGIPGRLKRLADP